jgi:hypothetical protein
MEAQPLRLVPSADQLHGIGMYRRGRRHLGHEPAIRSPEPELSIGLSLDLVAFLVDRAVVPATEQREVRERGGPAVRPVTDVMALTER